MSDTITARDLREALTDHALLSRSRGSSYADVARELGFAVLAGAAVWLMIGAPGVPVIEQWAEREAEAWAVRTLLLGGVAALAYAAGQSLSDPLGALLRMPLAVLSRLARVTVLLCGVATVSVFALVPGAYVVHLLNLG